MDPIINPAIEEYVLHHMKAESALHRALAEETHEITHRSVMLSGPVVGNFLKFLVNFSKAKHVLEIGMFTGASALYMAEGLSENGEIITCEINPNYAAIAKKYFAQSPVGNKIKIRMGMALETIKSLKDPLDFVFIDADKANYPNYYRAILPKVCANGLIVLDNSLMGSRVLNPKDPDAKAVAEVNELIKNDNTVENIFLSVRDGINLVRKLY